MKHLRDYQKDIVNGVNNGISKGLTSIMIQAPTGSGKSVIIAELLREYLVSGKRILLIAHKIELIEQLYHHVHRWLNFKATILADAKSYRYDPNCQVVIASIQSWSYRYHHATDRYKVPSADLVVIDEAHHSASQSYTNLFLHYTRAIKLGFTATPQRLDSKGLRYLANGVAGYQYMVKGISVQKLMDIGHLSSYKLFGAEHTLNADGNVRITAGDYNAHDLEQFVSTELDCQEVVDVWLEFAPYKKTVLYPVSVALSKLYVKTFNDRGIPSAHIDAKTSKTERKAILEDFRQGNILVLGQHSIIIEGVDVPDIEAVQFIRPTRSKVIWFQAIGRALRPAPNKSHAIIIDHTTTHKQLPMPDVPVNWSLDPKSYHGSKPHLLCSNCDHKWLPSQDKELKYFTLVSEETIDNILYQHGFIEPCWCRKCNHQELHQWTIETSLETDKGSKEIAKDIDMVIREVEVDKPDQFILDQIIALLNHAEQENYKRAWASYHALKIPNIGLPELIWLADELGYKRAWASFHAQQIAIHKTRQKERVTP